MNNFSSITTRPRDMLFFVSTGGIRWTLWFSIRYASTARRQIFIVKALTRLDYCNSLFRSPSKFNLHILQCIQNSAARIVSNTSQYTSITPVLKKLLQKRYCEDKVPLQQTFKPIGDTETQRMIQNVVESNRIKNYVTSYSY